MKTFFVLILSLSFLTSTCLGQAKTQVINSSNVEHSDEIWQLLSNGIHNFEVDVVPIYGELFVTATMPDSANHSKPTLAQAYLLPLFSQFKKNNGAISPDNKQTSYLILNIGFDEQRVLQLLREDLRAMSNMLKYKSNGEWHDGKLQLLIKNCSGKTTKSEEKNRFVGIAGISKDTTSTLSVDVMPLIELSFSELTDWNGSGNLPFESYLAIKNKVSSIHKSGRKISITDCPKSDKAWSVLLKTEVDFICTIYAHELQKFIATQKTSE